jgi:hypothetical protein
LTLDGAYSVHSTPASAAATRIAPRAWPTESAVRGSAPTNDSSIASASGSYRSTSPATPSKIVRSRSSGRSRGDVFHQANSSARIRSPLPSTTP